MTGNRPARDVAKHDNWISVRSWVDGRDAKSGRRYSSLGRTADFCATIRERYIRQPGPGMGVLAVCDYDWQVSRQRTEREGPDEHGLYWHKDLASGTANTMYQAKLEATRVLRYLRARHIAAGGDVGYDDAPTGERIRADLVRRRKLASRRKLAGRIAGLGTQDSPVAETYAQSIR